jgi:hypothetical protein
MVEGLFVVENCNNRITLSGLMASKVSTHPPGSKEWHRDRNQRRKALLAADPEKLAAFNARSRERSKAYRERNTEEARLYQREWQRRRAAERRELFSTQNAWHVLAYITYQKNYARAGYMADYASANKPKLLTYYKRRYVENIEEFREYYRSDRFKESRRKSTKRRRLGMTPEQKAAETRKRTATARRRRATDPQYRMVCRIRNRLWCALRRQGARKVDRTIKLLGCTFEEFKRHIMSKFTEGMTWERVMTADIHLDHIIPLSAFDLCDEAQQRAATHFTNLQPLWAADNLSKSDTHHPVNTSLATAPIST